LLLNGTTCSTAYDEVEGLEELVAVFWQDNVSGVFPSRDYVFDVYVVGALYKLNPVVTHSLKAPGFNP
jgi:hypothetical protein